MTAFSCCWIKESKIVFFAVALIEFRRVGAVLGEKTPQPAICILLSKQSEYVRIAKQLKPYLYHLKIRLFMQNLSANISVRLKSNIHLGI